MNLLYIKLPFEVKQVIFLINYNIGVIFRTILINAKTEKIFCPVSFVFCSYNVTLLKRNY